MDTSVESKIIDFFTEANKKFEKSYYLDYSDLKFLFDKSLELLSTTYPNDSLYKLFIVPEIIKNLLIELNNTGLRTSESRNKVRDSLSSLIKKLYVSTKTRYIKFRLLDKNGFYPNCDLNRKGIHYSTINQFPILLTTNNNLVEQDYKNYSEINWITRKELQCAVCVILAPEYGKPSLYFTDYNQIELNELTIKTIPNNLRLYFLFELLQLQNRFKPLDGFYIEREQLHDIASYNYFDFRKYKNTYNKLIDAFSIRNQLLMRTSSYLVKSIMLWNNRTFGEEAFENVFFALEGCLHLLQKKYGDDGPKLNRKLIKDVFINNFTYGGNIYEFIEEGYYKRISLVHPEPDWGANWKPFLSVDDFYEYFDICRMLLNFTLINRVIEY